MRRPIHHAICGALAAFVSLSCAAWGQPPTAEFNSMPEILEELRQTVLTATGEETLTMAAERLGQMPTMSSLIPLPTPGIGEDRLRFQTNTGEIRKTTQVLREAAFRTDIPDKARATMLTVKTNLEAELDTILTIGRMTAEIEPDTPEALAFLDGDLDRVNANIEELPPFTPSRHVRSPWPPFPKNLRGQPQEEIRVETVGINQCMVEVKEIFGLKRRVRWIVLPVWVEPWHARRRLVGYKKVWIYEWIPTEFIKKIITCNDCCNNLTHTVEVDEVPHPELLDYWYFYRQASYR